KISYTDRSAPQPVAAWPAGPLEVRVAFDRPVNEDEVDAAHAQIIFGEYVRAADRLEVLKPPYKAVQEQSQYPRTNLRVASAHWSADRRTLSLTTDPPSYRATYALTLPLMHLHGVARPESSKGVAAVQVPDVLPKASGRATQREDSLANSQAAVDLAYTLNGVEAHWKNDKGQETWTGWLPHLDLDVSQALTKGSAEHERLFNLLDQPG